MYRVLSKYRRRIRSEFPENHGGESRPYLDRLARGGPGLCSFSRARAKYPRNFARVLPTLWDQLRRYELRTLEFASFLPDTDPIPKTEEKETAGAVLLLPEAVCAMVDRVDLARTPIYRAPRGEQKRPDYFDRLNNDTCRQPPIFEPDRYNFLISFRFARATATDAHHMLRC